MKKSELSQLIREEIEGALKEMEFYPGFETTPKRKYTKRPEAKKDATYHADVLNGWDANPKWMTEDLISMATDLMRRGMGDELEVLIKALEKAIPELKKKRGM